VQHRIASLNFAMGLFTNLTHDHLDYHKTFAEYLKAKKCFFDYLPKKAIAIINSDDKNGRVMVQNCNAKIVTYALKTLADHNCKIFEQHLNGMFLTIDGSEIWTQLIGEFNAYNALAIYSIAYELGINKEVCLQLLSALKPVHGRFEYVVSREGVTGIVDYAHTPDAVKNVLLTIKKIQGDKGQVITVIGAGGDRDKSKRPIMAKIAAEFSDKVILTSDNPRSEDPAGILQQMKEGLDYLAERKSMVIQDRREAIKTACRFAKKDDIILVAGKGHEKYQEIMGIKHPFDDLNELKNELLIK